MVNMEDEIKKYLPFASELAFSYYKKTYLNIEYDDLYQIGSLAILEAYSSYDDTKGSFSTYVYAKIRYAILNYITENSFIFLLPDYIVHSSRLVANKSREYYQQYGVEAPIDYLMSELKTEKYINYLQEINRFYFVSQVASWENLEEDSLLMEENIEDIVTNTILKDEALSILSEFDERKKSIFEKYLGLNHQEPYPSKKIATQEGVSRQAVEHSYRKSLSMIKKKLHIYD